MSNHSMYNGKAALLCIVVSSGGKEILNRIQAVSICSARTLLLLSMSASCFHTHVPAMLFTVVSAPPCV